MLASDLVRKRDLVAIRLTPKLTAFDIVPMYPANLVERTIYWCPLFGCC